MVPSHQLQNTGPDNRIEPAILTELTVDEDTQNRTAPTSHRMLTLTLLISVLAHTIILALAATAARQQTHQADRPVARPSIQINFRQTPQTSVASTDQPAEPEAAPTPTRETAPAEQTPSTETRIPAENIAAGPDTMPVDTTAEATPEPPRLQPPSLADLRTAARNRVEQDRQRRTGHPDCLARERRNDFLDCGDEDGYDYARADQNDTVVFFTPAMSAEPFNVADEQTSTGARVKAAIDMFDNQLGTTQTKRRLMNIE